jgi:FAD binding domain
VPPTAAKGLNLAVSDVFYLRRGIEAHFNRGNDRFLEGYSATALRRVWGAERLSWWLTKLLHVFPDQDGFDTRCNQDEFDHLCGSKAARRTIRRIAIRCMSKPGYHDCTTGGRWLSRCQSSFPAARTDEFFWTSPRRVCASQSVTSSLLNSNAFPLSKQMATFQVGRYDLPPTPSGDGGRVAGFPSPAARTMGQHASPATHVRLSL